jgi:hypothetical protein
METNWHRSLDGTKLHSFRDGNKLRKKVSGIERNPAQKFRWNELSTEV